MQEENELVDKIKECNTVIRDIDNSPVWKIVVKDMNLQKKYLDDNWQNIFDEEKLQRARELKMSVMHILNIKEKYSSDLKTARERLELIKNPQNEIDKDYDGETILEG